MTDLKTNPRFVICPRCGKPHAAQRNPLGVAQTVCPDCYDAGHRDPDTTNPKPKRNAPKRSPNETRSTKRKKTP